ncbi:unnamed protein product, partial [Choristocarpus tenellus]
MTFFKGISFTDNTPCLLFLVDVDKGEENVYVRGENPSQPNNVFFATTAFIYNSCVLLFYSMTRTDDTAVMLDYLQGRKEISVNPIPKVSIPTLLCDLCVCVFIDVSMFTLALFQFGVYA